MPVIRIQSLPTPGTDRTAILTKLCPAVAEAFGIASKHVWAAWTDIPPGAYVEGDEGAAPGTPPSTQPASQPSGSHPPLVEMLGFEGKPEDKIAAALERTAAILAEGLGIDPGNVFIWYTEGRSGRVFDGGQMVRREGYTRDPA